ncbi:MAG: hypothetical protein Q9195_002100 [Heterodermia aff. obscurata]
MPNEKGLQVRIEEIELLDRKKSMIYLTKDPREVCQLLGLDAEKIGLDDNGVVLGGDGKNRRGFQNMEECWTTSIIRLSSKNGKADLQVNSMYEYVAGSRFFRRNTYIKHNLKSNDRKRMAQRDGYSAFVDDWLSNYAGKEGGDPDLTRQKVWDEVEKKYNIESVYKSRIMAWREERERLKIKGEGREERKRIALEEEAYANAWIEMLKSGPP